MIAGNLVGTDVLTRLEDGLVAVDGALDPVVGQVGIETLHVDIVAAEAYLHERAGIAIGSQGIGLGLQSCGCLDEFIGDGLEDHVPVGIARPTAVVVVGETNHIAALHGDFSGGGIVVELEGLVGILHIPLLSSIVDELGDFQAVAVVVVVENGLGQLDGDGGATDGSLHPGVGAGLRDDVLDVDLVVVAKHHVAHSSGELGAEHAEIGIIVGAAAAAVEHLLAFGLLADDVSGGTAHGCRLLLDGGLAYLLVVDRRSRAKSLAEVQALLHVERLLRRLLLGMLAKELSDSLLVLC